MLELAQTVLGRVNENKHGQAVAYLSHAGCNHVIYSTADDIVLVDEQLAPVRILRFSDGFPARTSAWSSRPVTGVAASDDLGLIFAWKENLLVVWRAKPEGTCLAWRVATVLTTAAEIGFLAQEKDLVALTTAAGVEIWRTDFTADVNVWDRIWTSSSTDIRWLGLSPGRTHLAFLDAEDRFVNIYSLDKRGVPIGDPQAIKHPRPVDWVAWRRPREAGADPFLYTVTRDSVFRIFSPIIDDPLWFQLVYGQALRINTWPNTVRRPGAVKDKAKAPVCSPAVRCLPVAVIDDLILRALEAGAEQEPRSVGKASYEKRNGKTSAGDAASSTELLLWAETDGSLWQLQLPDMERKPPALLRPGKPVRRGSIPAELIHSVKNATWHVLPHLTGGEGGLRLAVQAPDDPLPSLREISIDKSKLRESKPQLSINDVDPSSGNPRRPQFRLSQPIAYLTRTPNGRSLLAVGVDGEHTVWTTVPASAGIPTREILVGRAQWRVAGGAARTACTSLFAGGRGLASFVDGRVELRHIDHDGTVTPGIDLPDFRLGDEVTTILALSDVDDGISSQQRRSQQTCVVAACSDGTVYTWSVEGAGVRTVQDSYIPVCHLVSRTTLASRSGPEGEDAMAPPAFVLPVDPMGWHASTVDWVEGRPMQDMLLLITSEGDLTFWSASAREGEKAMGTHWAMTGRVHTKRKKIVAARCSARKKTALVNRRDTRDELSIWDSHFTEFSTGLEHARIYEQPVKDLDWTTTPDLQSILAIGFDDRVELLCEQRMDYGKLEPAWETLHVLSFASFAPHRISDSIWLTDGSFAIGAYNSLFVFRPAIAASAIGRERLNLFGDVVQRNGPLLDYHPQNVAQCMLWNKTQVVHHIFRRLFNCIKPGAVERRYQRLAVEEYWAEESSSRSEAGAAVSLGRPKQRRSNLFDAPASDIQQMGLSADELNTLRGARVPGLSEDAAGRLFVLADTFSNIEELRRSLDINGLRYLTSLRQYVAWQRELGFKIHDSGLTSPHRNHDHRDRLAFRNVVWATHSETQELLMQATTQACDQSRMLWDDAKQYGVFMWLRSTEAIRALCDTIARNEYLTSERDPTRCSLFYFALGKKNVVHGLWRQAAGHPEQQAMLRFLANDFQQARWKSAALKNAYALLSKQRYAYAAAFFLLGDSPKDAINICVRQSKDMQLATAIARVRDDEKNSLLHGLIEQHILPQALEGGHRWLAHWALWNLDRRELAGKALLISFEELAEALTADIKSIGEPENDDPSLALLVQHLRKAGNISLNTVSGHTEFQFVLHNAAIFRRMGCHSLALALVRNWNFIRPDIKPAPPIERASPTNFQEPPQADLFDMGRSPTNATAPKPAKIGMGIQSNTNQGAAEFDMGAFF